MDSRKIVFRETGVIALGAALGTALMFGIFALLGRFDRTVLLGGIVGYVLTVVNFMLMAIGASLAADRAVQQNVKGGKSLITTSYLFRMGLIFLVLFAFVKSGLCNAVASVLPLCFVRPTLTIAEFFRKTGE